MRFASYRHGQLLHRRPRGGVPGCGEGYDDAGSSGVRARRTRASESPVKAVAMDLAARISSSAPGGAPGGLRIERQRQLTAQKRAQRREAGSGSAARARFPGDALRAWRPAAALPLDADVEPEQQHRPHEDGSDQCQHAAGRLQVVEVVVQRSHDQAHHQVNDEEEAWSSHAWSLPSAGRARTNGSGRPLETCDAATSGLEGAASTPRDRNTRRYSELVVT